MASLFNDSEEPLTIRNNNPGAIKYGDFAKRWGGTGKDGEIASFADLDSGYKAQRGLLDIYRRRGQNSVASIIGGTPDNPDRAWAPRGADNNNTDDYIDFVAKKLGVAPNAVLGDEHFARLPEAMAHFEAGKANPIRPGYGASSATPPSLAGGVTARPDAPSLSRTLYNGRTPMADPSAVSMLDDPTLAKLLQGYVNPDLIKAQLGQAQQIDASRAAMGGQKIKGAFGALADIFSAGRASALSSDAMATLRGNSDSDAAILKALNDTDKLNPGLTQRSGAPAPQAQPQPDPFKQPAIMATPGTPAPVAGITLANGGAPAPMGAAAPAIWNNGQGGAIPAPPPAAPPPNSAPGQVAEGLDSPRAGFAKTPAMLATEQQQRRRQLMTILAQRPGPVGDMARKELEFDKQREILTGVEREKMQYAVQLEGEKSKQAQRDNMLMGVASGGLDAGDALMMMDSLGIQLPPHVRANLQQKAAATPSSPESQSPTDAGLSPEAIKAKKTLRWALATKDTKLAEIAQKQLADDPTYQNQQTREKQKGEFMGKAVAGLPAATDAARVLTRHIEDIANNPNLTRLTGPIQGALPTLRGASRDLQEKINQVGGETFLQAYNTLRGGGQITEAEGAQAKASLNRLMNLKQSDKGYVEALRDFQYRVAEMLNVARVNAGQAPLQLPPHEEFMKPYRSVEKNDTGQSAAAGTPTAPGTTPSAAPTTSPEAPGAEQPQRNLTGDEMRALPAGKVFDYFSKDGVKERWIKREDGKVEKATTGDEAKEAWGGLKEDISKSAGANFVRWLTGSQLPAAAAQTSQEALKGSDLSNVEEPGRGMPGATKESPIVATADMRDSQVQVGQFVKRPNGQVFEKTGPQQYRRVS